MYNCGRNLVGLQRDLSVLLLTDLTIEITLSRDLDVAQRLLHDVVQIEDLGVLALNLVLEQLLLDGRRLHTIIYIFMVRQLSTWFTILLRHLRAQDLRL